MKVKRIAQLEAALEEAVHRQAASRGDPQKRAMAPKGTGAQARTS
jgi:hypothetical protein